MRHDEVYAELRSFFGKEILEGEDVGLDASTSLLELGLINSMSVNMLIGFIEKRFCVEVPRSEVTPRNLKTLHDMTEMVMRLEEKAP